MNDVRGGVVRACVVASGVRAPHRAVGAAAAAAAAATAATACAARARAPRAASRGWWLRGGTHTTATAARTNLHAHVVRRTCRRVAAAVVARRRRPWTCAHTGSQLHYRRTLIDCVIIVTW